MGKPLPIGIEDFKELIENGYYYVDKSLFIKELLDNRSKVSLFMRPRRFGKTLNLSMLKYYFEKSPDGAGQGFDNRRIFSGLRIMDTGEAYTGHMGRYPVVSLSLKAARQPDWNLAYDAIIKEICKEFERHNDILLKEGLLPEERELFCKIRANKADRIDYVMALEFLTRCLKKVYRTNVILFLDEYDVPLENAYFGGFYEQMTGFIRSLFESALKTNSNLEFAVVTGCLRITKESIFTGLNNLRTLSIIDAGYAEYFGFNQAEVSQLLKDYGKEERKKQVQSWYDGYLFGNTEVYNPWSILLYVDDLQKDREAPPKTYWANTSSNDIVRHLIEHADGGVRQELESLIEGGSIVKPMHEEITYGEISISENNLWNFLFFTGYLTKKECRFDGEEIYLTLAIPNTEVKLIYKNTILEWFNQRIRQKDLTALYRAFINGETQTLEKELSRNLMETISFYDYREDYYHDFLGGLLKMMDGYTVKSNRESGLGGSDLLLLSEPYDGIAVIIEIKVADSYAQLEGRASKALEQMEEKQCDAQLKLEGYHSFIKYGIAFYKKLCRVLVVK